MQVLYKPVLIGLLLLVSMATHAQISKKIWSPNAPINKIHQVGNSYVVVANRANYIGPSNGSAARIDANTGAILNPEGSIARFSRKVTKVPGGFLGITKNDQFDRYIFQKLDSNFNRLPITGLPFRVATDFSEGDEKPIQYHNGKPNVVLYRYNNFYQLISIANSAAETVDIYFNTNLNGHSLQHFTIHGDTVYILSKFGPPNSIHLQRTLLNGQQISNTTYTLPGILVSNEYVDDSLIRYISRGSVDSLVTQNYVTGLRTSQAFGGLPGRFTTNYYVDHHGYILANDNSTKSWRVLNRDLQTITQVDVEKINDFLQPSLRINRKFLDIDSSRITMLFTGTNNTSVLINLAVNSGSNDWHLAFNGKINSHIEANGHFNLFGTFDSYGGRYGNSPFILNSDFTGNIRPLQDSIRLAHNSITSCFSKNGSVYVTERDSAYSLDVSTGHLNSATSLGYHVVNATNQSGETYFTNQSPTLQFFGGRLSSFSPNSLAVGSTAIFDSTYNFWRARNFFVDPYQRFASNISVTDTNIYLLLYEWRNQNQQVIIRYNRSTMQNPTIISNSSTLNRSYSFHAFNNGNIARLIEPDFGNASTFEMQTPNQSIKLTSTLPGNWQLFDSTLIANTNKNFSTLILRTFDQFGRYSSKNVNLTERLNTDIGDSSLLGLNSYIFKNKQFIFFRIGDDYRTEINAISAVVELDSIPTIDRGRFLTGVAYYDSNGDSTFTPNADFRASNQALYYSATGALHFTLADGSYSIPVPLNNNGTLEFVGNQIVSNASPRLHSWTSDTLHLFNRNFRIFQGNDNPTDLSVEAEGTRFPAPGRLYSESFKVKNNSFKTVRNVTVDFKHSDTTEIAIYYTYGLSGTLLNKGHYRFFIDSLRPFQHISAYVISEVKTTAQAGYTFKTTSTVSFPNSNVVDVITHNNSDTLVTTVVNSYDPNDKIVYPVGEISSQNWLTYTINFQNLGTGPAFKVVVIDTLDAQLDPASFKMLTSSHRIQASRIGRALTFAANEISLLPASQSFAGSMGYIRFKVKPLASFTVGQAPIANKAGIYFDYNPAVVTNTVFSPHYVPNGLVKALPATLSLYPNPAGQQLFISNQVGEVAYTIINNLGQRLSSGKVAAGQPLSVGTLSPGVYVLQLQGRAIRFVKE